MGKNKKNKGKGETFDPMADMYSRPPERHVAHSQYKEKPREEQKAEPPIA